MSGAVRRIVVVGRDCPMWLSACVLRQALAATGVTVTALELPSRLTPASLHSTLPAIEALHSKLGIEEALLLSLTGGTFNLGWNIVTEGGEPFFLGHGSYGAPIEGSSFFSFWLKARKFGLKAKLEDFSPTAMAARHGRFLIPDQDTELFGRTDYGYQLPAIAYAALLKSKAAALGVTIHQATGFEVRRDAASGLVEAVLPIGGGDPIAGDLFIDATGSSELAADGGGGDGIDDWSGYFPTRRMLRALAEPLPSTPAYGELRLESGSWTALNAVQKSSHVAYASSRDCSDDELVASAQAARPGLSNLSFEPVAQAIRQQPWSGNCIAIGASACALDPILDLDLHSVQVGLVYLLGLFPAGAEFAAERAEYNRITRSVFERLRDFQSVLYLESGQASDAPATVRHKLDVFRARGLIATMEDETFAPDQWQALLSGLGVTPESWPPAIDSVPPEKMKDAFRKILGFVHGKVTEMPTHLAYLADIGAELRQ